MTVAAAALAMVAAACAGAGEPDHQPQPPSDHQPPGHKPPGRGKPTPGAPEQPPSPQPFCQGDGWCWENPLPHGDALTGVWTAPRGSVAGANDTFAVGALGIIQRRHAGGWITDDSGVSVTLRGVWGSAGNDVWAVGDGGSIVHFDGARWSTVASGTTSDLNAVWGASASDVWIGGLGNALLHLTDHGWVPVPPPASRSDVHSMFGTAADDVWAVGERHTSNSDTSGLVMHWDGRAWTDAFVTQPIPASDGLILFQAVWAGSPTDVWVGGFVNQRGAADTFGTLIHFDGTTWGGPPVDSMLLVGRPITAIFGASPTDLWAAPGLHWDGAEWSHVLSERMDGVVAIQGRASDDLVAVGHDGRVLHFNGDTWEDWNDTLTDDLIVDAWGAPNGEIFAVTETAILHYDGRGWSRAFHGPGAPFVAVWGSGTDNVVFLREDGARLVMTDGFLFGGGPVAGLAAGDRLTDVWTAGDDQVWATAFNPPAGAGADGGRVLRFQRSGSGDRWQEVLGTPSAQLAISGSGASDIWVAGSEPVVQHFDGATWTAIPVPGSSGNHDAIWVNSPTDVWLAGFGSGAVHHWDGTAFAATPGSPSGAQALWSNGPHDVWAAGGNSVTHWDGEAWTESATNAGGFPFWQAVWQTPDGKLRVFGDGGAILRK
jgi:hypothetical protein